MIKFKLEYYYRLFKFKRKYFKLVEIEVENINTQDSPDFSDAFISNASWRIPLANRFIEASKVDLEYLNEETDLVYANVIDYLY